jgi:Na+-driven multidrug efflux pump
MIVFGVFLGLTLGITKLGSFIGEDKASAVRETVSRIGDLKLGLLCLAVGIVLLLISEKISEKIIAKKEY